MHLSVKSASLAKEIDSSFPGEFDLLTRIVLTTAFGVSLSPVRPRTAVALRYAQEGMVLARRHSSWPCDALSVCPFDRAASESTDHHRGT